MKLQEIKTKAQFYANKIKMEVVLYKTFKGYNFIEKSLYKGSTKDCFIFKPERVADSSVYGNKRKRKSKVAKKAIKVDTSKPIEPVE